MQGQVHCMRCVIAQITLYYKRTSYLDINTSVLAIYIVVCQIWQCWLIYSQCDGPGGSLLTLKSLSCTSYCNLDCCWIYPRPYHWAERLARQHRGVWHCQSCVCVIISLACALIVASMVLSSHSHVVLLVWAINTLKPKKLVFPQVHNWYNQLEMLKRLVYHWNCYLSDFFKILRLYLSSVSDIVLRSSLNQIYIKTL